MSDDYGQELHYWNQRMEDNGGIPELEQETVRGVNGSREDLEDFLDRHGFDYTKECEKLDKDLRFPDYIDLEDKEYRIEGDEVVVDISWYDDGMIRTTITPGDIGELSERDTALMQMTSELHRPTLTTEIGNKLENFWNRMRRKVV